MSSTRSKVVFKDYNNKQNLLLPPSFEEMIPSTHPVRVVAQIVDSIDIQPIIDKYPGGGASSYYPRMLLKVLIYGYLCNYYSSREIEQAIKSNIHFMWLSGMSFPDHNTINRFRGERLKDVLKNVFTQVVDLLIEAGLVDLKEVYLDGTKIEANANRYTFVWANTIKTNKAKISRQLEELWSYTEQVAKEELEDTTPTTFQEVDAEKVKKTISKIDDALQGKKVDKKVKEKLKRVKRNWPKTLEKYEEQEKLLNGRKSCSKTDPDASFMRMKEDHLHNSQLKAAYNVQFSTQDQFVLNYTVHQNASDTTTLKDHVESYKHDLKKVPDNIVADAGYGSEENYDYLDKQEIGAYIKYGSFDNEKQKSKKDPFQQDYLYYNETEDCFYCPMGQRMTKKRVEKRETATGYQQEYAIYQAENCTGCPLRGLCNKDKENRKISVNHNLRKYKKITKLVLLSEQGLTYMHQRAPDVEGTFGNVKENHRFRRFYLRGIEKVEIETGLLAISQNIRKISA